MAAASNSRSDLTVVLFNCGPRKVPADNAEAKKIKYKLAITEKGIRKKCVEQVLNRLPIGDECNLFLLVQDKISKQIHKCISNHVRRPSAVPHNKDAGVYSFSLSHVVEYLNKDDLRQVSTVVTPEFSTLDRLTACVITEKRTTDKMLLVSWHGQYKISDIDKAQCYRDLIDFLKQLQDKRGCLSVMIGGDFNLSIEYAKQVLTEDKPELEGEVCDDYRIPDFRAGSHKIDYIVRWPARYYNQLERAASIRPHFEPNNGDHVENPFDHPIIKFRFTAGPPGAKSQTEADELTIMFKGVNLCDNTLEDQEEYDDEEDSEDETTTDSESELEEWEEKCQKQLRKKDLRIKDLNQQIEDLKTEMQRLRMDSTNRTTDSSTPGGQ